MKNTQGFPLFVKIGLVGIYSKKTALAYFWVCIGLSVISLSLGFVNRIYFIGLLFLVAALWYWMCIKWIDKNSKWEKDILKEKKTSYAKYPIVCGFLFGLLAFVYKAYFANYSVIKFVKTDFGPSFYTDYSGIILTELVFVFLWGIVVYLVLLKVSKIIPDLIDEHKYLVALYLLLSLGITSIVLSLVILGEFRPGIGILPLAITFIIPALYKPKKKPPISNSENNH